mmetsp:Transcript_78945/g.174900  ORF Transcript_78945/g.174900 Transcript_78945/m.174900 type:complete len:476 (+) Transcript_78945:1198-2625(+)
MVNRSWKTSPMAPFTVEIIVAAVRWVCQKSSKPSALPLWVFSACKRILCQALRRPAVVTNPRTAGSKPGSAGLQVVPSKYASAAARPWQTRSTSCCRSASSSGMRLARLRAKGPPRVERCSNAEAVAPAGERGSAARSMKAKRSPVPMPLPPPATSEAEKLDPSCRNSASFCMSEKTSKARQTSEAPARAANISGVSPSTLVSSATPMERWPACKRSKTSSTANKLPLSAAQCKAPEPFSSPSMGSARALSKKCNASACLAPAAAPKSVSRRGCGDVGSRALLRKPAIISAALSTAPSGAMLLPPPPWVPQIKAMALVFTRCTSVLRAPQLLERAAAKRSCSKDDSSALARSFPLMLLLLRVASSSGNPGGVIRGGVGDRGGVAPVAVRSTGRAREDKAQGGAGPRGVRGVAPSACSNGCCAAAGPPPGSSPHRPQSASSSQHATSKGLQPSSKPPPGRTRAAEQWPPMASTRDP